MCINQYQREGFNPHNPRLALASDRHFGVQLDYKLSVLKLSLTNKFFSDQWAIVTSHKTALMCNTHYTLGHTTVMCPSVSDQCVVQVESVQCVKECCCVASSNLMAMVMALLKVETHMDTMPTLPLDRAPSDAPWRLLGSFRRNAEGHRGENVKESK